MSLVLKTYKKVSECNNKRTDYACDELQTDGKIKELYYLGIN